MKASARTRGRRKAISSSARLLSAHFSRSDKGVECRGLSAGIPGIEWSRPHLSELIVWSPILIPNALRIGHSEMDVSLVWKGVVEGHQIPKKDPLELDTVPRAGWLAPFVQDSARISEVVDDSRCNGPGRIGFRGILILLIQFDETGQDDTLVVSPCGLVIVLAVAS